MSKSESDESNDEVDLAEQNNEGCIINLQLTQGFIFKHITEFFHAGLTTIIFRITNKGVYVRNDNKKGQMEPANLLADLTIPRKMFTNGFYIPQAIEDDDEAVLMLAVEASVLRGATGGIMKADMVSLIIKEDTPLQLDIRVVDPRKDRDIESSVKLIPTESLPDFLLNPLMPVAYDMDRPNAVGKAAEFMKACAGSGKVKATTITVVAQQNGVMLNARNGEFSKKTKYGVFDNTKNEIYHKNFAVQGGLQAVVKACPMSKVVRMYCSGNKPLLISLDVGTTVGLTGVLDVYLVPQ
jgi:hypothetical protein